MHRVTTFVGAAVAVAFAFIGAPSADDAVSIDTTAPVLWQPSMNVFRRFAVDQDEMFEFYGDVLNFERLQSFGGVHRFQAGNSELKLTRRVERKSYEGGGVDGATGLRLLTFFFPSERELAARFQAHGLPAPQFQPVADSDRKAALVMDPDGQAVELVIVPDAPSETLERIEVGLTVADLDASRAFYREFVGLTELPAVEDALLGTTRYPYRHGTTTINLFHFAKDLPADTGSGGIQYVVSNVDQVAALVAERNISVDQPLTADPNAALRTIWLNDPDGVTNYFAETTYSRAQPANRAE